MADTKVFADGFYFERRENAPDFVVGRLSVKVNKAKDFLDAQANDRGYVNLNILRSRDGGYYMEVDQWQPKKREDGTWTPKVEESQVVENEDEDVPF